MIARASASLVALATVLAGGPVHPTIAQPTAATEREVPGGQRVAVVDVRRVLSRSIGGNAARTSLEREKARLQAGLQATRDEAEKLRAELASSGSQMSTEERSAKLDAYEQKRRDAHRIFEDVKKEFGRREQRILEETLEQIRAVILRVGEHGQYSMILEKQALGALASRIEAGGRERLPSILYSSAFDAAAAVRRLAAGHDVTDDVVDLYDADVAADQAPSPPR